MIRLFVGLALPEAVRTRLAGICAGLPGVRWVGAENLHVTVRFIGDIDEGIADEIHDALSQLRSPRFCLEFSGVGTFGAGRRPHTLWAGIVREPALMHLHDKVESALVRTGLPPEPRKFTPHVTLARLREPPGPRLPDFMAQNGDLRLGPVAFDRFVLFSSHLGRNGPSYTAEAAYALE